MSESCWVLVAWLKDHDYFNQTLQTWSMSVWKPEMAHFDIYQMVIGCFMNYDLVRTIFCGSCPTCNAVQLTYIVIDFCFFRGWSNQPYCYGGTDTVMWCRVYGIRISPPTILLATRVVMSFTLLMFYPKKKR